MIEAEAQYVVIGYLDDNGVYNPDKEVCFKHAVLHAIAGENIISRITIKAVHCEDCR